MQTETQIGYLPHARPPLPQPVRDVRGLELTMAQLGVTDLIVGKVAGDLCVPVLRQAAYRVQARHPSLRAAVVRPSPKGRPAFVFGPPDIRRIVVEEVIAAPDEAPGDPRPLWQRVAESEVNRRFDLADGYMFRVVWVPAHEGPGHGGHLVLAVQHAVVDGVSLMRLMNDILVEAADLLDGSPSGAREQEVLPPTAAVLTQIPVRFYERIATSFVRRTIIRAQRLYATYSPFPIEAELPAGQALETHCRFRSGDPAKFAGIRAACKENGVTVGGAFSAAVEFASLRLIHGKTGRLWSERGRIKFPMTMDFSLRRSIPGMERTSAQIGLFTGACDVSVPVDETVAFWDLARAVKANAEKQFEKRTPLLFHQVLDGLWDLPKTLEEEKIDYVASGGIGEAVNISNVGEYPYPTRVGGLELEEVFGLNTAMKGGPMFIVWLRAANGRFFYNATSASPAAGRATGDALLSHVFGLMEACHTPSVSQLTLRDYAQRPTGEDR